MNSHPSPPVIEAADLGKGPPAVMRWLVERPFVIDVFTATVSFSLQVLLFTLAEPGPLWPGVLIAAASAAPLFWRRRAPFLSLCGAVAIGAVGVWIIPGVVVSFPFAFALYNLAATGSFPRAALGYAIGVGLPALCAVGVLLTHGQTSSPSLVDPLALIALSLGLASRNRRQRREALAALVNQRLENARVVERGRITAEMHDVVAHSISIMIALAEGASKGWERHPERAAAALQSLSGVGRTALADMRRVLHLLRDNDADLADALHHSGHNLPDLDDLVEVFRNAGLPVHLIRTGRAIPDDPALATTLYHIAQEALTNALRYAGGVTRVDVRLESSETTVTLTVTDDGHAPASGAPSQGSGRGLQGIAERAAAYEGTSTSGRLPTGGWRTTAFLRLTHESSSDP